MKKTVLLFLLISLVAIAQEKSPEIILQKVKDRFSAVKDYEVNVNIKIDVEFLKVPETNAIIYYKSPDKTRVKAEGFALIPKEGLNFTPLSLLKNPYTPIYKNEEKIDGRDNAVVQIIPSGSGEFVLATVWVDRQENYIRKVEATTKFNGTFYIDMKYDLRKTNYALPVSMVFSFSVDQLNIPREFTGDTQKKHHKTDSKTPTKGTVYIVYNDYKVNIGVPDNVFLK